MKNSVHPWRRCFVQKGQTGDPSDLLDCCGRGLLRRDTFLFLPEGYCSMNLGKIIPSSVHLKGQDRPRTSRLSCAGGISRQKKGGPLITTRGYMSPSKGTPIPAGVSYTISLRHMRQGQDPRPYRETRMALLVHLWVLCGKAVPSKCYVVSKCWHLSAWLRFAQDSKGSGL